MEILSINEFILPVEKSRKCYLTLTEENFTRIRCNIFKMRLIYEWLRKYPPYKHYSMSLNQVCEIFQNLAIYSPLFISRKFIISNMEEFSSSDLYYQDKPLLLFHDSSYYEKYNVIADYFQDKYRLSEKNPDAKYSPVEQWNRETPKFVETCLREYENIDAPNLREIICRLSRECTGLKPNIAAAMICVFKPTSILDFYCGGGAQLIGAIAKNIKYTGIDSNIKAIESCRQIIAFGNSCFGIDIEKYQLICSSQCLDSKLLPNVDMVFINPPHSKLENWLEKFPSILANIWLCLNAGGVFILNLNDQYIKRTIDYVNTLTGAIYQGVIGLNKSEKSDTNIIQPIWIWKKKKE
jgi:16S rRNA G966 N2-methylase RsmD